MTSRERMLIAMTNGQPDMVPVAPDISYMIPTRLTGKPAWQVHLHADPPLWRAYLQALRHFRFDGWFNYANLQLNYKQPVRVEARVITQNEDMIELERLYRTPAGDLRDVVRYGKDNSPVVTRKVMQDIRAEYDKLCYIVCPEIDSYDGSQFQQMRRELGEDGVASLKLSVPGLQWLADCCSYDKAAYWFYDEPELVGELLRKCGDYQIRLAEMQIESEPDFILFSASGLWTLNSESIFREFGLPVIQRITRMAREAGIPTMLHSCGRERDLVRILAEETELDCANPVEPPPMGDCDLAQLKRNHGHRIALMGNLHTTDVMLMGSEGDVEIAAKKAIDDAGAGGGFILSTGDQCGRDTPYENIFRLVDVARNYGRYQ